MKKLFIIGIILCSGVLNAQDIFQQNLYSANLVFQNSFAISLSDQQLEKITKIHSQSSKEFFTGKLDLDEASAKLKKMLSATKPNPEAVIRQLDIVLNLENSLKKKKLSTLVAIKNELSETQQKELSELKGVSDIDDYDFSNKPLVVGPLNIVDGKNPNLKMRVSGDSENSPLMLLSTKDGMVEIEDIEKINSEDISGMSVIKNGVLIITLKKDMQEQFEK